MLATALSELSFESYMQKMTLPQRAKLGNVVLLAPDLDVEVAPEKILAIVSDPDVPHGSTPDPHAVIPPLAPFHLTVYVSPDDKALATSSWLFGSLARLGTHRSFDTDPGADQTRGNFGLSRRGSDSRDERLVRTRLLRLEPEGKRRPHRDDSIRAEA